jgi:hypothetical protein
MSQERNHSVIMDMTGRVLSLEQRFKGLQGRLAAIEARLSCPGGNSGNDIPEEDFVPATGQFDKHETADYGMSDDQKCSAGRAPPDPGPVTAGVTKMNFDITGMIAGAIMLGAGILLFTENLEIIKNPLVAIGCGILLMIGALKGKSYK